MKKLFVISILILFDLGIGNAQGRSDNVGTSAANFLKIDVGSRAVAMGGAYSALAQDATALYWNPAGIANLKKSEATFSYADWIADTKLSYAGLVIPLETFGTIGLSVQSYSSGDIRETTLTKPDGTGRFFDATDLAFGFTYARAVTDRFSFGGTLKIVREDLANESATAFAFDIGSVFRTDFYGGLRIAFVMANFGSDMRLSGRDLGSTFVNENGKSVSTLLETTDWELPLVFRFGLAFDGYKTENSRFSLAFDVNDTRDFEPRFNAGAEYAFAEKFYLRGGYRFNYDEESFTAGAGLALDIPGFADVKFNYALVDGGIFNLVHRYTIALGF